MMAGGHDLRHVVNAPHQVHIPQGPMEANYESSRTSQ